eukprot:6194372-Pleurochrysis_carterae.AAC.3
MMTLRDRELGVCSSSILYSAAVRVSCDRTTQPYHSDVPPLYQGTVYTLDNSLSRRTVALAAALSIVADNTCKSEVASMEVQHQSRKQATLEFSRTKLRTKVQL